jgi:hypothetical protein
MAEKEYVERSEAKRIILENEWKNPVVPNVVNMILDRVPAADVVEVVRCKDCKHATFYSCTADACYRGIICEYRMGADDENFFCSYGERKRQK